MGASNKEELIKELKKGETDALRKIYDQYHQQLYNIAIKYLKNRELAEDAVQDVFVKLWNHKEDLQTAGSFKSFLCTSIKNHVLNMIRDNKNRLKNNYSYTYLKSRHKNITKVELLYDEYREIFESGLDELSEGKKEIFEIKMRGELTNKEIAEKLNLSVNTIKSQYYKASRFIKEYLEKHAGITFD